MSQTHKNSSELVYENILSFYSEYDPIIATKMVIAMYGNDMISSIDDTDLRIVVWQVCHSLEYLEENAKFGINDLEEVRILALETQYETFQRIAAKHLINALDSLANLLAN